MKYWDFAVCTEANQPLKWWKKLLLLKIGHISNEILYFDLLIRIRHSARRLLFNGCDKRQPYEECLVWKN